MPRIVVERVATPPPPVLVCDPTHLVAYLVARAPVKSATFMLSSVPEELRSAPCFFFRAEIRGQSAHALADTGASENFVSAELARALGVMTHPQKHPVHIRIADGSVLPCDQFARIKLRIGTWTARMAFTVLPTGVPLVLGMPFFLKYEPRILWRSHQFVIDEGRTTHVLSAELTLEHFNPISVPSVAAVVRPPPPQSCGRWPHYHRCQWKKFP